MNNVLLRFFFTLYEINTYKITALSIKPYQRILDLIHYKKILIHRNTLTYGVYYIDLWNGDNYNEWAIILRIKVERFLIKYVLKGQGTQRSFVTEGLTG